MSYTKGKWEILPSGIRIADKKGNSIASTGIPKITEKSKANAERICLCVNGWDELVAQRDELLEACQRVCKILIEEGKEGGFEGKSTDEYQILEQAIANCEKQE